LQRAHTISARAGPRRLDMPTSWKVMMVVLVASLLASMIIAIVKLT
jgi:hypothetical protein